MAYCINHFCNERHNPDDAKNCLACGNSLLINGRIRLLRPLRSLNKDPYSYIEVFEVEDTGTTLHPGSKVRVMKVLKWNEPKLVEYLRRESLALQLLDHPGIPSSNMDDYLIFPLKDTFLELHCLVMQKMEGENLREWLKTNGRIPQRVALNWFLQLINILDVVHRSGFFHRDIKPENIIHQPDGKLALVDFGAVQDITRSYLTKISTSGGTSTGLGSGYEITSIVTPFFTPNEQINGQTVPQSDFFALGRTFVNLITGISLIDLPKNKDRTRLIWRNKAPHIDKPFADFIDDMMAPAPGQRPQNTQIILQRLEQLPFKLKLYRLLGSKLFRGISLGLILLILIGGYKGANSILANYVFNLAVSQNKSQPAKKYYELALIFNEKNETLYNNLAVACQNLQDLKCAKENYEKALKLRPDKWEAHYNLGSFYDEQDDYEKAEEQYKLAIKYSNNQAANAVSNLARLKNKQKKYDQAAALALEGLKHTTNPQWQASLYKNLGWARLKQQKYTEANEYLQKSVDLDSQRIDAYCLLAQTQQALKQLDYARTYWEFCLLGNSVNSSLPEVQTWRQELLDQLFK